MIFKGYASKIMLAMEGLTALDMRIVVWMSLNAQYADGRIFIRQNMLAGYVGAYAHNVCSSIKKLEKRGLLTRISNKQWRVAFTFPRGKYCITVPKKPLFEQNHDDFSEKDNTQAQDQRRLNRFSDSSD